LQARSKKVRRSSRTIHLRLFTNRGEDEDPNQTDDRPTSCGLFKTPHYLSHEDADAINPDCHINVFSLKGDSWGIVKDRIERNGGPHQRNSLKALDGFKNHSICKTCNKRAELMMSLGGFG